MSEGRTVRNPPLSSVVSDSRGTACLFLMVVTLQPAVPRTILRRCEYNRVLEWQILREVSSDIVKILRGMGITSVFGHPRTLIYTSASEK